MTKLEQTKNSSWNFNTDPVNEWAYWDKGSPLLATLSHKYPTGYCYAKN